MLHSVPNMSGLHNKCCLVTDVCETRTALKLSKAFKPQPCDMCCLDGVTLLCNVCIDASSEDIHRMD